MGTRSISVVKANGLYHSQYTQFDGYLREKGYAFLEFVAKAYSYLVCLRAEEGHVRYAEVAQAIGRGYLWQESLLTGHGYRFKDKDGHVWSYREQTELDLDLVCGWTEYVRMADFDEETLSFYRGADLSHLMFSIPMKALAGEMEFRDLKEPLKTVFEYIDHP